MYDARNAASGFSGTLRKGIRPALVVIDFQRAFTQPDLSPLASHCDAQLGATNQLIDAMRGLGPVIFTSAGYDANALDAGVWLQKNRVLATLKRGSEHCELDERLHFDPSTDLFLSKTQASGFFGTPLAALLAAARIDMLVVAGTTTSGCVRATVVDAIQNGFAPFVVAECVCDRSQAQHDSNLVDMQSKYAEVVSLASMLDDLETMRAKPG